MTLKIGPIGKLIVVCSQKGGIVKSQSSSEIAHDLRKAGFRVLEIDMDWTTGLTERAFPDDLPYEIEREPLSNSFTPGEANTYQLSFRKQRFDRLNFLAGVSLSVQPVNLMKLTTATATACSTSGTVLKN